MDAHLGTGGRLRWGYDPEAHGALCSRCSLYGKVVVPSELRAGALLTIVAEAPGHQEELLGFPLVGPSGDETMSALKESGLTRNDVSLCNVMCCRAPEASYEAHVRLIRYRNKDRRKHGVPELLLPHEACLPRLIGEIKGARALVLIGKQARQAIIGIDKDELARQPSPDAAGTEFVVEDEFGERRPAEVSQTEERIPARGFPGKALVDGREIPCLTSVHPAFVLRSRRWTKIFRWDIAKAVRMARGHLQWTEPRMTFFPKPDQLRRFLFGLPGNAIIAYDTETDSLEPTEARLRCIGIGTKDECICVPFTSVEVAPSWGGYAWEERAEIRDILLAWFANPTGTVVAQHEKYDHSVLKHCGELPGFKLRRRVFDTAVAHHVAWSEWPHDLDFLIAQYTDAPHHKGVRHDRWKSDRELHKYCMLDVARTAEVAEKLLKEPALRAQKTAFVNDLFLSTFCRHLSETGFRLDVAERDRLYQVQTEVMEEKVAEASRLATRALEVSGKSSRGTRKLARTLNPNSYKQVGKILYEALGVEPAPEKAGGYTDTGDPSTKSDTLY
ncbi:MAG: uracil-DNA glycosylase family protein, partial [Candidatus Eisenbacteria bacterium]